MGLVSFLFLFLLSLLLHSAAASDAFAARRAALLRGRLEAKTLAADAIHPRSAPSAMQGELRPYTSTVGSAARFSPSQREICGNGILEGKETCDLPEELRHGRCNAACRLVPLARGGRARKLAPNLGWTVTPEASGGHGSSAVTIDLDGDGRYETITGQAGGAGNTYVSSFFDDAGALLSTATFAVHASHATARLGRAGDLDGDGVEDLCLGQPGDGLVVLYKMKSDGDNAGSLATLDGADAALPVTSAAFGHACTRMDDAEDGSVRIVISDIDLAECPTTTACGGVYIVTLDPALAIAAATLISATTTPSLLDLFVLDNVNLGAAIAATDVDRDGVKDLVLGAPGARHGGALVVLLLDADGAVRTTAISSGWAPRGARLGAAVAAADADLNGDGVVDLVACAPRFSSPLAGEETGACFLIFPSADGHVDAANAHRITSPLALPGDHFGASLVFLGDLDGDVFPEILVGAPQSDDSASPAALADLGAVHIISLLPSPLGDTELAVCGDGIVQQMSIADPLRRWIEACDDGNGIAGDGCSPNCRLEAPRSLIDTVAVRPGTGASGGLDNGRVAAGDLFGTAPALLLNPDVNGDAVADVACAFIDAAAAEVNAVLVAIMDNEGSVAGFNVINEDGLNPDSAIATSYFTGFGSSIASLGDVDASGSADLVVGSPGAGIVWLVLLRADGSPRGAAMLNEQRRRAGDAAHVAAIGDVDGNGAVDIAFASMVTDYGGVSVLLRAADDVFGVLRYIDIAPPADVQLRLRVSFMADPSFAFAFQGLSAAGDVNGDGVPDLLVVDKAVSVADAGSGLDHLNALHVLFLDTTGSVVHTTRMGIPDGQELDALDQVAACGNGGAAVVPPGSQTAFYADLKRSTWSPLAATALIADGGSSGIDCAIEDNDLLLLSGHAAARRSGDAMGALLLDRVAFTAPCGDGIVDSTVGETCDDGNAVGGDGCSATCLVEPAAMPATASSVTLRRPDLTDTDEFGSSAAVISRPDVNGDGYGEVAVASAVRQDATIFFLVDNVVAPPNMVTLSSTDFGAIAVGGPIAPLGDVDDDDVGDLALTFGTHCILALLESDGTPASYETINFGSTANTPALTGISSIASLGDMDRNGVVDLAFGDGNGETVVILFLSATNFGDVLRSVTLSSSDAALTPVIDSGHRFGASLCAVDIDGDSIPDLAVGQPNSVADTSHGSVVLIFLESSGAVASASKIEPSIGTANAYNNNGDVEILGEPLLAAGSAANPDYIKFGSSIASVGDLDGNGAGDIVVGSTHFDHGTHRVNAGACSLFHLTTDGDVKAHELLVLDSESQTASARAGAALATGLVNCLSPSGHADNVPDLVVGAPGVDNDQGTVNLYLLSSGASCGNGIVEYALGEVCDDGNLLDGDACSSTCDTVAPMSFGRSIIIDGLSMTGLFAGTRFGESADLIANPDVDGDGYADLYVGAPDAGDGVVFVLLLNPDGTVKSENSISSFDVTVNAVGYDGASIGDLNGDGIGDLVVGSEAHNRFVILLLQSSGEELDHRVVTTSETEFFTASFSKFGNSVAGPGDVNGDGIPDIAVGDPDVSCTGVFCGRVYLFFMDSDVTIKSYTILGDSASSLSGMFPFVLSSSTRFGTSISAAGDVDRNGVPDLVIGSNQGSIYVVLMEADGVVKTSSVIDHDADFAPYSLTTSFGKSSAGAGRDLNGDGVPDIVVGAPDFTLSPTMPAGGLVFVFLNVDGTVKGFDLVPTSSGLARLGIDRQSLDSADSLPYALSFGDVNGDGELDLVTAEPDPNAGLVRVHLSARSAAVTPKARLPSAVRESETIFVQERLGDDAVSPSAVGRHIAAIAAPDVNGDGVADVVASIAAPGSFLRPGTSTNLGVVALMLNADGTLASASSRHLVADDEDFGSIGLCSAGDVNGDGVGDYVAASSGALRLVLLQANGNVKLTGPAVSTGAGEGEPVAIGDVDGDGLVDFAVADPWDDTCGQDCGAISIVAFNRHSLDVKFTTTILANDGSIPSTPGVGTFATRLFPVGDVNMDGMPDVGAVTDGDKFLVLFLDSSGSLAATAAEAPLPTIAGVFESSWAAAQGGCVARRTVFDGETHTTLAVPLSSAANGVVALLDIDETGSVALISSMLMEAVGDGHAFACTDVDRDGTIDVLSGHALFDGGVGGSGAQTRLGGGSIPRGGVFVHLLTGTACGNGVVDEGEACDDGNAINDDGCTMRCTRNTPNGRAGGIRIGENQANADLVGTQYFGRGATGIFDPDINRDGIPDLASNGMLTNLCLFELTESGQVASSGTHCAPPSSFISGQPDVDGFGSSMASLGDWEGDGGIDLLVGTPSSNVAYIVNVRPDFTIVMNDHESFTPTMTGLNPSSDFGYTGGAFGSSVANLGDVNGDGITDIAIGDPSSGCFEWSSYCGVVYVVFLWHDKSPFSYKAIGDSDIYSGSGGWTHDIVYRLSFGNSLASPGDLDGNGVPDLVIGASTWPDQGARGAFFVLFLEEDGTVKPHYEMHTAASVGFLVDSEDPELGYSIAAAGDMNGDGIGDVLIGAPGEEFSSAFIVSIGPDGAITDTRPIHGRDSSQVLQSEADDRFGKSVGVAGDVNGDGLIDIVIGAPESSAPSAGSDAGAAYIFFSSTTECGNGIVDDGEECDDGNTRGGDHCSAVCQSIPINDVKSARVLSETFGSTGYDATVNDVQYGTAVATVSEPDLNRDGIADLAVATANGNEIHLLKMSPTGDAMAAYVPISPSDLGITDPASHFGVGIVSLGDLGRDGGVDLAAGITENRIAIIDVDSTALGVTSTVIIGDGTPGFSPLAEHDVELDNFGAALAAADINNDGSLDLIAADPTAAANGRDATGVVFVIFLTADKTVASYAALHASETAIMGDLLLENLSFGVSLTAVGDVNADGVADIAVRSNTDTYVLLLERDGHVSSYTALGLADKGVYINAGIGAVGDLNGDGVPDLVGASTGGSELPSILHVYLAEDGSYLGHGAQANYGTGGTSNFARVRGASVSATLASADMNGDGTLDLVVGFPNTDDPSTDGVLAEGAVASFFLGSSGCGDGVVDDATEECDDGNLNDGDACSSSCKRLLPSGKAEAAVFLSEVPTVFDVSLVDNGQFGRKIAGLYDPDLNGDGIPDVAVGTSADRVYLFALQRDGMPIPTQQTYFDSVPFYAGSGPFSGSSFGTGLDALGDWNGDGVADLVITQGTAQRVLFLFMETDLSIKSHHALALFDSNFDLSSAYAYSASSFGDDVAVIGDVNGDGISEIAIGDPDTNCNSGSSCGIVFIVFLNTDCTVQSHTAIGDNAVFQISTSGGFSENLMDFDHFGAGVTGVGDLNDDGIADIAIGAPGRDGTGALFVLLLQNDGTVAGESAVESGMYSTITAFESAPKFGASVLGAGDLDGDGIGDVYVSATDDRFGGLVQGGGLFQVLLSDGGSARSVTRQSPVDLAVDMAYANTFWMLGDGLATIGDLDGNGIDDFVVGASGYSPGAFNNVGAINVLFGSGTMCGNGIVDAGEECDDGNRFDGDLCSTTCTASTMTGFKNAVRLGSSTNGMNSLNSAQRFGRSVSSISEPDLNDDDVPDLVVGDALGDGTNRVYLVELTDTGAAMNVAEHTSIDGFSAALLGWAVAGIGDFDGNGVGDYVVSTLQADSFLLVEVEDTFTTKSATEIKLGVDFSSASSYGRTAGGFPYALACLGDLDGNGVVDILGSDQTVNCADGSSCGIVYVLLMNADKSVLSAVAIGDSDDASVFASGGLSLVLESNWNFGLAVTVVGDVNKDGVVDVAVGTDTLHNVLYVLFLSPSGTVQSYGTTDGVDVQLIATGGRFGSALAPAGDWNGDGIPDLMVSDYSESAVGQDVGTMYVLNLDTDGSTLSFLRFEGTQPAALGIESGDVPMDNGEFGYAMSNVGDVNRDGIPDFAVSAPADRNDGGAVYLFFGKANSCGNGILDDGEECDDGNVNDGDACSSVCQSVALSGIQQSQYIGEGAGNLGGSISIASNTEFGRSAAGLYAPDVNGDSIPDLIVSTQDGFFALLTLGKDGTVADGGTFVIGEIDGFTSSSLGAAVDRMGDLDGDGVCDVVVTDPDSMTIFVLLLNSDSTIREFREIAPGNEPEFDPTNEGVSLASLGDDVAAAGDINGDGVMDILVGDTSSEVVLLLFLSQDWMPFSFKAFASDGGYTGNFQASVGGFAFGRGFGPVGDVDRDGIPDIALTASGSSSSVYLCFMESSGTVRTHQAISHDDVPTSGYPGNDGDMEFGRSATSMGDMNGDGIPDLLITSAQTGGPSTGSGVLTIAYLDLGGSAIAYEHIQADDVGASKLAPRSVATDSYAERVRPAGDVNGDGLLDLVVSLKDFEASNDGAVAILFASGALCGNGVVDPGEDCDDGSGLETSLCSARCTIRGDVTVDMNPTDETPYGTNHIQLQSDTFIDFGPMTVETWAYIHASDGGPMSAIFSLEAISLTWESGNLVARVFNSRRYQCCGMYGTSKIVLSRSDIGLSEGSWHHFAVVVSDPQYQYATSIAVMIDGVMYELEATQEDLSDTLESGTLGALGDNTGASTGATVERWVDVRFAGYFRAWSVARSAADIRATMFEQFGAETNLELNLRFDDRSQAGTIPDYSGYGLSATFAGEAAFSDCGNGQLDGDDEECDSGISGGTAVCTARCLWAPAGCIDFASQFSFSGNNYVQLPRRTFQEHMNSTVEFWVFVRSSPSVSVALVYFEQMGVLLNPSGNLVATMANSRSGNLHDTNGDVSAAVTDETVPSGVWTHVAVSMGGSPIGSPSDQYSLRIRFNGVTQAITHFTLTLPEDQLLSDVLGAFPATTGQQYGVHEPTDRFFNGQLGHYVRGWATMRGERELRDLMYRHVTDGDDAAAAGLIVNYQLGDDSEPGHVIDHMHGRNGMLQGTAERTDCNVP